jgi:hypothetical protein
MADGARPGEMDWWSDYWLAAATQEISAEEIRSFWNGDEAPSLLALIEGAPEIEVGPLYADESDGFDAGPARRIFNILFLRGTTPDYVLPIVSDSLIAEIRRAAVPAGDDQVSSATTPDAIEAFLTGHEGWSLVPLERRTE